MLFFLTLRFKKFNFICLATTNIKQHTDLKFSLKIMLTIMSPTLFGKRATLK